MTSKYELLKFYFAENFQLNLHKNAKWEDLHTLSKNDEFLLRKTELLEDEGIRLTFKLIHKEMDEDMTLRITKYPDNSTWKNWKKIDSEFIIQKVGRVTPTKVISKRVLILDVTRCTTFDCTTCDDENNKMCYTDEHFCSFEIIKQALGEQVSNSTTLPVSFAGFLCTYGDYEKSKIMSPINSASTLMREMQFSDIKISSADGRQFCAHKVILSAISDVFNAMLNTDMKEKNIGIIELNNLSASGLQAILNFIYNGEIGDEVFTNVPLLLELLQTADKYNINGLVDFCTEMIWLMPRTFFRPENAIDIFILSQQLKIRLLEVKAVVIVTALDAMEIANSISLAFDKLHDNGQNKLYITKFLGIILSKFRKQM